MKHKLDTPVDINVKLEFDKEDVEDIIDKVTEAGIVLISVTTVAHILKKLFRDPN